MSVPTFNNYLINFFCKNRQSHFRNVPKYIVLMLGELFDHYVSIRHYIYHRSAYGDKKGGLVHVAPACAVFGKGPTSLNLVYTTFPYIFA
jgi:hypothetical protein